MAAEAETLHFLDYWRVIRARKEIVIAVFLLLVLTGVLITYARPKVYAGSAVIQVKEEKSRLDVFGREALRFDPLFLRTQFEIIQSAPVIEEVIRRREFETKLSKAYGYDAFSPEKIRENTFKLLSNALNVQHYRDTNLIEIKVFLRELGGDTEMAPYEAAAAANTIAQVFRDLEMDRSRRSTETALNALLESLEEQRKKVAEASKKVEEIRQQYGLAIMRTSSGSDTATGKLKVARLEEQMIFVRRELERKRARYNKVFSLSADDLRDSAVYIVGDKQLAQLIATKRMSDVELREAQQASLGDRHPDVMRIKAVIDELNKKITEALKGLKTGVQADFETSQAEYGALEVMLEKTKAEERVSEESAYREFDKAVEDLEHAKRIRDALELRYLEEKIELDIPRTFVELIELAKPTDAEDFVSPNLMLNTLLSIVMGLVCGVGLAYFVEYIDTSVKTIEDVERFMSVPVVGVIPQKVEAFVDQKSYHDHAEAYRMLRTNVRFSEKTASARTFCVTSGSVAEGKSLTVFNLAYVCAQLGDRCLIVDSDLHRPRQHKILDVSNKMGLANVLVGDATLEECLVETPYDNLQFLPSGRLSAGVHGLLDTSKMRELIKRVGAAYDLVIFDAPPIIGVSDASLLAREVDAVLLVVQHRKYPRSVSNRAKTMVENAGGRLAGVVLNNINISKDYSYYYHYSHYYYPRRTDDQGQDVKSGRRRSGRNRSKQDEVSAG